MGRLRFAPTCSAALTAITLLAAGCATMPGAGVEAGSRPADVHYQDPTAKTLYAMSRVLQSQGKLPQAEIVLLRLVKEYGDFVPSYSDLAGLRVQQGRLDEALALLEAAAKMAPNDPVILNNRGICLLMKGNAEGALPCFEKAAARNPQSAKYRANAALALGMLRRDEESLELYKEVVPVAEGRQNLEVIRSLRPDTAGQADASAEVPEPVAAQQEAERLAAEDAARVATQQEAERLAAEEAARVAAQQEAERLAAEEAARVAAQQEAERVAAEEAARVAAQQETERLAAEEAARVAAHQEAERVAAEEAARVAAQQEAERLAAEEAARVAAQQEAARLAARQVAQELAAQDAAARQAKEGAAGEDAEKKKTEPGGAAAPDSPKPNAAAAEGVPAAPAATDDTGPGLGEKAGASMAVVDVQPLG